MSSGGEGTLTQLALAIQTRNREYQQELTDAASQASSAPAAALTRFDRCWDQSDKLEQEELAFLAQMGDWGSQQIQPAKDSWKENRLQILVGKAQVLVILGRYDNAQAVIDSARSYVADPTHPAAATLDELEVLIIQAKG